MAKDKTSRKGTWAEIVKTWKEIEVNERRRGKAPAKGRP
jgi:hypothetical protein